MSILLDIPEPFATGFGIEKVVFDGVLVHLDDPAVVGNPPESEEVEKGSEGAEVVVEDVVDEEEEDNN